MRDTKRLFRKLDDLEAPVRWSDVERRVPQPTAEPPLRRRFPAAVVAFAVFVGAAGLLWLAARPVGDRRTPGDEVTTPVPPPSGEQVLVTVSTGDGRDFDIYRMDPDGTDLVPILADPDHRDDSARLSPDGTRIVFVRSPAPSGGVVMGGSDIWVMDADGTDLRQLTFQPDGGATHDQPAWSPDGTQIAYRSNEAGPLDVWVMDADGSGQRRLTDVGMYNGEPVWSPDGARIAFDSDRERPEVYGASIWLMDADGAKPTRLTDTAAGDIVTSWSPGGSSIAFQRSEQESDYAWDVWVMGADGGNERRLTDWPGLDAGAVWSPDGERLMFVSDRSIGEQAAEDILAEGGWTSTPTAVYVMEADGSNVVEILPPGSNAWPSDWVVVD